jgi:ornithine cyclodeaminase
MSDGDVLIVNGNEVLSLLQGKEGELIEVVRRAYATHGGGDSSLPHSTFLKFPGEPRNRVIALPAYLGGDFEVAGIKWVASFPDNHQRGLDRASAIVILNSSLTGRPQAILEGSVVSAKRTAASAVLAARSLHTGVLTSAGMIGCGPINLETARFLISTFPELEKLFILDVDKARAERFKGSVAALGNKLGVEIEEEVCDVLKQTPLISFATTAIKPHVYDLSACQPGSTILHISLRDLSPEVILSCDNIVDDTDHVCRAQTSLHLAEQLVGQRDFIRCTLADILGGAAAARRDDESLAVFSPFGLGVLDVAVSTLVCDLARKEGRGTVIRSFLPETWDQNAVIH